MSSVETQIREASAKNKELLQILAETAHAVPDLVNQDRFVRDLKSDLEKSNEKLKSLERKRKNELRDHEKYRDSVMRRFAFKMTGQKGKFEARAEKEEKEYFDVIREEHLEQQLNTGLSSQLDQARKVQADLKATLEKHKNAQRELDGLYQAIFSGPTTDFPDEDEKEKASNNALQAYHDARVPHESEQQALQLLREAGKRLISALNQVEDALDSSRMDMLGGGQMFDMMERNALHKAELLIQETRMLIMQAQRASPTIRDMSEVTINHGHIMRDVFFDNIFTDMDFHDEIHRAKAEVEKAIKGMKAQIQASKERYESLGEVVRAKEKDLETTRWDLQRAREQAFEKLAS